MVSVGSPSSGVFQELGRAVRDVLGLSENFRSGRARGLGSRSRQERNVNEDYEDVRLHMVALACEVVVLVALIEQDLVHAIDHTDADEIKHACAQHRIAADRLLGSQLEPGEERSLADLCAEINEFYTRLEDLSQLRDCTAAMKPRKALRRARTLWPPQRL
jgi:hypothetical protein